jgi:hypothetical protein
MQVILFMVKDEYLVSLAARYVCVLIWFSNQWKITFTSLAFEALYNLIVDGET